jgi:anti-anti-sigma factor
LTPVSGDERDEMANLSVRSHREGATLTISLAGELDAHTAERFKAAIAEAESTSAAAIVLDLTGVHFVDSSGLVALLMASRRSEREGTRLRVRAGAGEVRDLLELTTIDQKLNLID